MRKLAFLTSIVALFVSTGWAQETPKEETPKTQIFVGYSTQRDRLAIYGWNISVARHLSRYAVVADFSGHYQTFDCETCLQPIHADLNLHHFLLGPQVSLPSYWRLRPFARAMVGADRRRVVSEVGTSKTRSGGGHFAVSVGGGIDLKLSKHLSARPIQLDVIRLPELGNRDLVRYRFSFGLSFGF